MVRSEALRYIEVLTLYMHITTSRFLVVSLVQAPFESLCLVAHAHIPFSFRYFNIPLRDEFGRLPEVWRPPKRCEHVANVIIRGYSCLEGGMPAV